MKKASWNTVLAEKESFEILDLKHKIIDKLEEIRNMRKRLHYLEERAFRRKQKG